MQTPSPKPIAKPEHPRPQLSPENPIPLNEGIDLKNIIFRPQEFKVIFLNYIRGTGLSRSALLPQHARARKVPY